MPVVDTNGIATHYEIRGDGPPLLMCSPGGFNATLDNWSTLGRYRDLRLVDHLSSEYTCILFDRRESGRSGGNVERLGWDLYAEQAAALLDHLGIARAAALGGCAGCSVALALAVRRPSAVRALVLFSPAGGARYRLTQQARFAQHLAHVQQHGTAGVVELALGTDGSFSADGRIGPWAPVIRSDPAFAGSYARLDVSAYSAVVAGSARLLFDRDTVAGVEPEDLMGLQVPALVVPGHDDSHATSAARYLEECLPRATYLDVAVEEQDEALVADRILSFLGQVPSS